MEIVEEKICHPYNCRIVFIVKDELGNVATGCTLEEAHVYLKQRRDS